MKQYIKDLLSNNDNASSNRVGFLTLIGCVVAVIINYIIISIKGIVWGLSVVEILDKMNILIAVLTGSGIITKNLGGIVEYFKKREEKIG